MYKKLYISIGLLWGIHHYGQVVLTSPPAPNSEVADPQSIRMLPGFKFNSVNGTFRAYIGTTSPGNPGNTYTPITIDYSANISNTENYIYTRQYLVPTEVSNGSLQQIQSVQFFDGLGRPKQSVSIKSTPTGKDLVTHIPYDGFGRQVDSWLPVPMASQSGNIQTGVEGAVNAYYQSNGINDSFPFSHKNLENSPLDRILSQKNPGADWQNKPVVFGYEANTTGEVTKYTTATSWVDGATSSVLSLSGTYGEAQLYKNTVTDEDNNKTIEFKNGKGQTLLVRKVISASENADTYYVYNEYDQLAFVIPPLASASASVAAAALEHLCYQYKYDGRSRLVEKKLPGKGWEQMVYNKKDQLILYRDTVLKNGIANFTADQSWNFTKYDQFGRVVYTGISRDGTARQNIQTSIDNQASNVSYEARGGSFALSGMNIEYGNVSYPTSIEKILTVSYYDTYPQGAPAVYGTVLGQEVLPQPTQGSNISTKSLPTASYVKNIDNDSWTKAYTYYDKKGRAISTHSVNHLGGYTKTESLLKFSGVPEYTLTEHKRAVDATKVNIKETFEYDHQERLVRHWNEVNGGVKELLAENLYNDLGQVQTKNVGNTTGSPLQSVKYAYNIRGWLTKLNEPSNLQNKLFAYELRYSKPDNQFSGSAKYNGNISQMSWITQSDAVLRNYSYEYDGLNRLKEGRFWDAMNLDRGEYHEKLTYDLNGNIKSLLRRGRQLPGYTAPEVMDDLEYHYENGEQSNKLAYLKEMGTGNALSGYPLSSGSTGSTISYDLNGNMTLQQDKGISIQYNYLNLPGKVSQNAKVTDYIYRADGVKVRKLFGTDTTDYIDGFQYENGTLKFFPTAEGYFNFETGKYVYNYTDHLGNTRLSYFKNGSGAEIIEESNYYPFGLKHEGYNVLSGNPAYKYKYNGKELQESGMYDYGARFYMPDIGRWGVIDPKAEQMRRWSTYNYAFDNPIRFIDPDGRAPVDDHFNKYGKYIGTDKKSTNNVVVHSNSSATKLSQLKGNTGAASLSQLNYNSKGTNKAVSNILAHYAGEKGISGHTGTYSGSRGSALTMANGNIFFNTKALSDGTYDNAYNIKSTLNHEGGKLGHKNENIPANRYTFVDHATVYLNEAKNPDFGKTTQGYRYGQAASFGQRVLNAAEKEASYGADRMNMINEYNEGNTGSVTITPYNGGNNLPTSTTITVSVGNSTYPSNPYEDIKHPQD
ncbi:hypothetical protein B0A69_01575 [Chryseobacterium shigense]|uniref:RHS repeat-associated core domain-containing protein n=1 Tax=Chryseobacterium shigense TaxID=297244 RepID=A0A1N7IA86_9FLAO|nr:DUF6443 domain-containing protein [Chryseobacterium shigense]PQA96786.1 hypothetical protein B0A69_01575 [Chryseobacterium shigense]SIS34016.1 RHS repeat-associated core domain-containing protein [Chryseobacterium shigense]